MRSWAGFILKVLIISAALSMLIKYGGPTLAIPATPINALIAVFLPTLVVAIALWRRALPHIKHLSNRNVNLGEKAKIR